MANGLLIRDFHPDVIRGFALPAEVSPPSFRRKRPWCTTPSTWWPPPLNAPPRSPSAPSSATDTNPGASDHASWTCSKTWVRFSGPYPWSSIHPIHPYHSSPPRQFPRAAGAETEELVDQIRRVFVTVALRLVSGDKGVDGTRRLPDVRVLREKTRERLFDSSFEIPKRFHTASINILQCSSKVKGRLIWAQSNETSSPLLRHVYEDLITSLVILGCLIRHCFNKWATQHQRRQIIKGPKQFLSAEKTDKALKPLSVCVELHKFG